MKSILNLRYKMFHIVNIIFYLIIFLIGFFFGFTGKKILGVEQVQALESREEIEQTDNIISVDYLPFFIKESTYNNFVTTYFPGINENAYFIGYIGINIMFYVGLFIMIYVFKFLILAFKNACF